MIEANSIIEAQRSWRAAAESGDDSAHRAATAAMTNMRYSVLALCENLASIGYPEVPGLLVPSPELDGQLRRLEVAVGGTVPPVVASFWYTVGGISLVDLDDYNHAAFWKSCSISSPSGCCDGVHVDPLQDLAWLPVDFLDLSPDLYHKDDISGGNAYGVQVGDGWLAAWRNFEWRGVQRPVSAPPDPCDFLGYLRTAILECAGFPALFGVANFEPVRQRLLSKVPGF